MARAFIICALGWRPGGDTALRAEKEWRALLRRHAWNRGGYLHLGDRELVLRERLQRRSGFGRFRVRRRTLSDFLRAGRDRLSARPAFDSLGREFLTDDSDNHLSFTGRSARPLSHGVSRRAHGTLLHSTVRAVPVVCLRSAGTDGPTSEGLSRLHRDRRRRAGVIPLRAHGESEICLRLEG